MGPRASGALLRDVHQLVRQQAPAGGAVRIELLVADHDVVADRVGVGALGARRRSGGSPGMHTDVCERRAEP